MPKHIVFIGHEASRTGAPLFLLDILCWIRRHSDHTCELVLLSGGELLGEYRHLLPCTVLAPHRSVVPASASLRTVRRLLRNVLLCCDRLRVHALCRLLRRRWKRDGVDLFYLNTIVSGNIIRLCRNLPAPIVTHIHELSLGMTTGITTPALSELRKKSDAVIAVSGSVASLLTGAYAFPASRVCVIPAAISSVAKIQHPEPRAITREALGIGERDIVVGMCGTVEWRKGVDLFVQLARSVKRTSSGERVHFLWVGGSMQEPKFRYTYADRYGLSADDTARIHFTGSTADVPSYLAAMDIFTLTSREDPFPLVHLEAAASGLPVICFEGAGGAGEWMQKDGAGFVVPFGDISAMAARVLQLMDDAALRRSMGATGRRIVLERFTMQTVGPQILGAIGKALAEGKTHS